MQAFFLENLRVKQKKKPSHVPNLYFTFQKIIYNEINSVFFLSQFQNTYFTFNLKFLF